MLRQRAVRLALGLFLAFGLGGCEVEPMHPRDAGLDAAKGDGRAPISDGAVMNPDISARAPDGSGASSETKPSENPDAPADLLVRNPDSNPDPRLDVAPDRSIDVSPDSPRDRPIEGGRVFGDVVPDRAPYDLAADRTVDNWIPGPDLAPDVPASDVGGTKVDASSSQPGLSVLAGLLSGPGGLDGVGPEAQFYFPGAVALDGAGNLYIADSANNTIRKIVLATRQVSTVAGLLGETGSSDGIGAVARFYSPQGLAADQTSLYIADSGNHTIRKLDLASGQVTTFAGSAGKDGHLNGQGTEARFQSPTGLALDGVGNLFVTALDHTIRKIVLATGEVTTVAGQTGVAGSQDGTGTAATFAQPRALAADGAGHLYVADTENTMIRKIVLATGEVTTLAGVAGTNGSTEGIGSAARFLFPTGLAIDGAGNLYVADEMLIRKVVLATAAVSNFPWPPNDVRVNSVAYDGAGNLYATETAEHTVIRVSLASQTITTVAGQRSSEGNQDGVGGEARFFGPQGLASDNQGGLFVVNGYGNTIRKIDIASGRVTTLAGSLDGNSGSTDGVGPEARFYGPQGVAYDGVGSLYIADTNNGTIRKLALATGMVTTFAGTPHSQKLADGRGSAALFFGPSGLAFDGAGNLYVTDKHAIRKIVLADATVTTLAGPLDGYGSADGIGAQARFDTPTGLVWDGAGNLYVADTGNCTIRQIVVATGSTTTFAGSPGECSGDDGQGTSAHFNEPAALAMDPTGRLLVADGFDNTVRRIDLATKRVTTIIGHSGRMQTIPGPLPAYVANPAGLAVLSSGDLAISDLSNNVILLARF